MILDLSLSPTVLALIGLVFGSIIGSFLNVVVLRLPMMLKAEWTRDSREFLGLEPILEELVTLSKPRSRCPHCGAAVKPIHNIPILSYCYLRGRCHSCSNPISLQYPLVEIFTGLVTAYLLTVYGITAKAFLSIALSYALIVLAVIDLREKLLPDQITLPLLWLGLLVNLNGLFASIDDAILGVVAGYLPLWMVFWLFKLVTGKEGMGYGDFKLAAALGAWLGWQMSPVVILLSSLMGTLVGCCAIFFAGRDKNIPFAFGPYLCVAGWVALQWGDSILQWFVFF